MISQLQVQLEGSEQMRIEQSETIDQNKNKARNLLLKKDIQIQRLIIMIQKLEIHLKSASGLSSDQISKISMLREDDLKRLSEFEAQLYDCPSDQSPTQDISEFHPQVDRNGSVSKTSSDSLPQEQDDPHIVYIRNVFIKYLEYLALSNTREIKTIENILFSELQVTKDQAIKLDQLRKTNSFWKKMVQFSQQPVANTKITAGDFKKKFFTGMGNFIPTIGRAINHNAAAMGQQSNSVISSPMRTSEQDQDS